MIIGYFPGEIIITRRRSTLLVLSRRETIPGDVYNLLLKIEDSCIYDWKFAVKMPWLNVEEIVITPAGELRDV